jgi:cell division protein FtsB
LALLALAMAALDEDAGVARWRHLRGELAEANERIAALGAETARLRLEAQRLEGDAFAIERAIREELELARPGQQVVRLPRAGSASDWNP